MLTGKQIFITGGAGFIGATLIGRLINNNKITIFDNLKRDSLSHRSYSDHSNLTLIKGSVLDYPALHNAMRDSQIVIHCAAIAGIDTVVKSPTETMKVNLVGTSKTLEAAATLNGLERFLNFSTSEVFGSSAFRSEETDSTSIGPVGEARWTYAVSKLAAEHMTKAYHQEFDMPCVTVRPFNVYGPGQIGEGALSKFISQALRNETIQIHGEGNQIRAWCYIDDFIDGLMILIESGEHLGIYHVGTREEITISAAAALVAAYFKREITIVPGPEAAGGAARPGPASMARRAVRGPTTGGRLKAWRTRHHRVASRPGRSSTRPS